MRRGMILFLLCLICLSGCEKEENFFAQFRNEYRAEVEGELYGLPFAAQISARQEESGRFLAAVFRAPETLAGTVLERDPAGKITICVGTVRTEQADGMAVLLDLFPEEGEVVDITVTEGKHTVVEGDGFSLEFLPDGTPFAVRNGEVFAKVISFSEGRS